MVHTITLLLLLISAVAIASVQGVCEFQKCLAMVTDTTTNPTKSLCTQVKNAITCAETTVLNNADCTSVKQVAQTYIDTAKKDILGVSPCDGVSGLMSSLSMCLGLSGLVYIVTNLK